MGALSAYRVCSRYMRSPSLRAKAHTEGPWLQEFECQGVKGPRVWGVRLGYFGVKLGVCAFRV